jgi:hypothetical protein
LPELDVKLDFTSDDWPQGTVFTLNSVSAVRLLHLPDHQPLC